MPLSDGDGIVLEDTEVPVGDMPEETSTLPMDVPQTGDQTPTAIWVMLLLAAGCAMYYSKKKYN